MLLTISLLCSGREKTTKDCMESIKKIKDGIGDAEIIVVDTGCDDEMREMIAHYADQIIPFTWCNDFAKARNVGVDAASGQWFMFIDDDEWFIDPQPIIDFFVTGQYKGYVRANYKIRNYKNLNGESYQESINSRIFKFTNRKINRFVGKVHELFECEGGDCYHIDCHAEHYGYAYATKEDSRKHSLRNVPLLLEMMEEQPEELRWPLHLVIEYKNLDEYIKLQELCEKVLSDTKNDKRITTCMRRPVFYIGEIVALLNRCDYDNAKKWCKIALSDNMIHDMAKARIYQLAAFIFWSVDKDYSYVQELVASFLKIYESANKEKDIKENAGTFFVNEAYNISNINDIFIYGAIVSVHANEPAKAKKYFEKIIWDADNEMVPIDVNILNILNEISQSEYHAEYEHILEELINDSKTTGDTVARIKKIIAEAEDDNALQIFSEYAYHMASDNYYMKHLRARRLIYKGTLLDNIDILKDYFNSSADFLTDDDIWTAVDDAQISRSEILKDVKIRQFASAVDVFVNKLDIEGVNKALSDFNDCFMVDDRKFDYLQLKIYEAVVVKTKADDWEGFDDLIEAISLWTQVVYGYYSNFLKEEAMYEENALVDDRTAVAFKLRQFLIFATEDFRTAFACIKDAIGICPELDDTLTRLSKLYGEFYKKALEG